MAIDLNALADLPWWALLIILILIIVAVALLAAFLGWFSGLIPKPQSIISAIPPSLIG